LEKGKALRREVERAAKGQPNGDELTERGTQLVKRGHPTEEKETIS